jgi:hypothetical protein
MGQLCIGGQRPRQGQLQPKQAGSRSSCDPKAKALQPLTSVQRNCWFLGTSGKACLACRPDSSSAVTLHSVSSSASTFPYISMLLVFRRFPSQSLCTIFNRVFIRSRLPAFNEFFKEAGNNIRYSIIYSSAVALAIEVKYVQDGLSCKHWCRVHPLLPIMMQFPHYRPY